jgi:hypothetical protein
MRSFREFFNEAARLPFAGGTQYSGHFDLPDLKNLHDPGERPEGGWGSFHQITRAATQAHQMHGSDAYILRDTLEKFRALAENVMASIILKNRQKILGNIPHSTGYQKNYDNASFDPKTMIITGLSKNEIIGGEYPRLRNEEMERGVNMGILFEGVGEVYSIDVEKLREEMTQLRTVLRAQETKYKFANWAGKMADATFDSALKNTGNIPDHTKAS